VQHAGSTTGHRSIDRSASKTRDGRSSGRPPLSPKQHLPQARIHMVGTVRPPAGAIRRRDQTPR
jgi:hypothetical protein